MAERTKAGRSAIVVALPHEVTVDIVGRVAVSSPQPMADLCSLRTTCKTVYKASKERAMGRRMAPERVEQKEAMKWMDNERYLTVVNHLADASNPEACFIISLMLVCLDRAAVVAGHKVAAYMLGRLLYMAGEALDVGKYYISQVEGEPTGGECEKAKRTNRECRRCQRLVANVVSNVTWKMAGPQGWVLAVPKDDHHCTSAGCGMNVGWDDYVVFCSDDCRIRHEYAKFFA